MALTALDVGCSEVLEGTGSGSDIGADLGDGNDEDADSSGDLGDDAGGAGEGGASDEIGEDESGPDGGSEGGTSADSGDPGDSGDPDSDDAGDSGDVGGSDDAGDSGDPDGSDDWGDSGGDGTEDGGSADSGSDDGAEPALCGNGMVEMGEVCDDGNQVTEFPPWSDGACAAACDLRLDSCGNGAVDAGEVCDDGNDSSDDFCTTSCTRNHRDYHDPCSCTSGCSDTDPTVGQIVGCGQVEVPDGAELACFRSGMLFGSTVGYFAEGECGVLSSRCWGGLSCAPDIGNYDAHQDCPSGTVFVETRIDLLFQGELHLKTCRKACETDIDCRWNAQDEFWKAPGEYRCVTEPQSKQKICLDQRNPI